MAMVAALDQIKSLPLNPNFLDWLLDIAASHCNMALAESAAKTQLGSGKCIAAAENDYVTGYSINSSTLASSVGGTVRPSALAVLRFMISSNAVACRTGRSAGFVPLRIWPAYVPAWR